MIPRTDRREGSERLRPPARTQTGPPPAPRPCCGSVAAWRRLLPVVPKRKIYFYRIVEGGPNPDEDFVWNARPLLARAKSLPQTISARGTAYVKLGDDALLAIVGANTPTRAEVVFAKSRRSHLPLTDQKGKLAPIQLLADQGLCETTHLLLLPKHKVAVATFNFHGPRLGRFPGYLRAALNLGSEPVRFDQLLMNDALERLDAVEELARFEVRITPSFAETFAKQSNDDIAKQLAALGNYGGTEQLTLKVSRGRGKAAAYLAKKFRTFAKRLGRRDDARENVHKLVVAGPGASGVLEEIDLLGDTLVVNSEFPEGGDDREHEIAFRRLLDAYKENAGLLDTLPGASVRRVKPRRS